MSEPKNRPSRQEDSNAIHVDQLVRPDRATLGQKDKLKAPQRPGWVRRWINDVPGRLQYVLSMGYRVVTETVKSATDPNDHDTQIGSGANRAVGGGVTGVLVETPTELYEKGVRDKEAARKELENDLLKPGASREVEGVKGYGEVTLKQ